MLVLHGACWPLIYLSVVLLGTSFTGAHHQHNAATAASGDPFVSLSSDPNHEHGYPTRSLLSPPLPTCPFSSELVEIDFDTLPDGATMEPGSFVSNQWNAYGVDITAKRRLEGVLVGDDGNWARIFDSSNPTRRDRDLGSPNKNCPGCTAATCPGFAARKSPGFLVANVTNCVPQNNILIIHGSSVGDEPNDNAGGGTMEFTFNTPVTKMVSLGLMDIESVDATKVKLLDRSSIVLERKRVAGLGDNTAQEVSFTSASSGTTKLRVELYGSGAVTSLRFCRLGTVGSMPNPTALPTPLPTPPTSPPVHPSEAQRNLFISEVHYAEEENQFIEIAVHADDVEALQDFYAIDIWDGTSLTMNLTIGVGEFSLDTTPSDDSEFVFVVLDMTGRISNTFGGFFLWNFCGDETHVQLSPTAGF